MILEQQQQKKWMSLSPVWKSSYSLERASRNLHSSHKNAHFAIQMGTSTGMWQCQQHQNNTYFQFIPSGNQPVGG